MGASVFFMLNGFLTVMNIQDRDSFLSFAYRRIIHLYPVYLVSVILTTIFMIFLSPDEVRSLPTILINFAMLQSFVGVEAVDVVYWTLMYQILFYAYVGLIILLDRVKSVSKSIYLS